LGKLIRSAIIRLVLSLRATMPTGSSQRNTGKTLISNDSFKMLQWHTI
jgi:hypothetical protein